MKLKVPVRDIEALTWCRSAGATIEYGAEAGMVHVSFIGQRGKRLYGLGESLLEAVIDVIDEYNVREKRST